MDEEDLTQSSDEDSAPAAPASAAAAGNGAAGLGDPIAEPGWSAALHAELGSLRQILVKVEQKRASGVVVYPPAGQVFRAFNLTPFEAVKVVIMAQCPYHGPGQALSTSANLSKSPSPGGSW